MKSLTLLTLALTAGFATAATPYSQQMADSVIARKVPLGLDAQGAPFTTYEHGVIERAFEMVYNKTGNSKYYKYLKAGVDNLIDDDGVLLDYDLDYYTLDDIRLGQEFLYLYLKTKQPQYKTAADTLKSQIDSQPRNPQGGLWHRSTYPNQMWLDGQYMTLPFYAQYTSLFSPSNNTAWSDIAYQFTLLQENVRNSTTGLLAHGYDSEKVAVWSKTSPTGAAPHVWDRALGWWAMALVDVLDYFPKSHSDHKKLVSYFKLTMEAVKKSVDPKSNGWWLVMDEPGKAGNYIESSAGAMFVYSFFKGIRKGLLDEGTYMTQAEKSYEALVANFVNKQSNGTLYWEGTVQVGSLGSNGTFEYYIGVPLKQNDLKGLGPFVMASVEYEQR